MSTRLLPKKEWNLTQESFARFLLWLHPNPDEAGNKYESIRRKLIKIFVCRGCTCPEDLADETINRVIHRAHQIVDSYEGDPALYFYGVANHVHQEYRRKKPFADPPPYPSGGSSGSAGSGTEDRYECLEKCIEGLLPRSKELLLHYYQEEKQAKIDFRKKMASQLGIPLNALRIRAFRIRMNMQACVQQCLQNRSAK